MKVTVKWKDESRELGLDDGSTPADAVRELGLSVSTKIIMRGGKPIPTDEKLEDGDDIWIIETVSGG